MVATPSSLRHIIKARHAFFVRVDAVGGPLCTKNKNKRLICKKKKSAPCDYRTLFLETGYQYSTKNIIIIFFWTPFLGRLIKKKSIRGLDCQITDFRMENNQNPCFLNLLLDIITGTPGQ